MRDRGQGKTFILAMVLLAVLILSMLYGIGRSFVRYAMVKQERMASDSNVASSTQATTGASMQVASGGSVETTTIPQEEKPIDVSGLDSLASFMTDESFQQLKQELLNACNGTDVTSMKRMDYQNIMGEKVTSYVLLSDGRVFECDYRLQSAESKVQLTSYDEQAIKNMEKKKAEAAAKKLEQKRKAQKKKLAKAKKKSKKKKKTKKEVG